ncbi:MAG: 4Fe-4S cluster-binding domain-containing protein [Candidatus Thorarchaeota archaeon]|nr:4Fe-4S cluster-binding domain-containing protein [Candidatus Thorarchaeota archaeon]
MKRKVRELNGDSKIVGELPKGCKLCAKGTKMVLFVTGLCDSSCYYCPLSEERANQDSTYADEMLVTDDEGIFEEVNAIGAEGAGISGGDPLCRLERTLDFITKLKHEFGKKFHLHLYTSKADITSEELLELERVGLDEIRFHPQGTDWSGIERALKTTMSVGIEVPAIPGKTRQLMDLAQRAEQIGVSFVNLNELETSETNFERLMSMGMKLTSLEKASVQGSAETAIEVVEWATENLKDITVHFCTARYKDAIQLRNRLERRLERVIRPFELRDDDDPLLILGVIRAIHGQQIDIEDLTAIYNTLQNEYDVPSDLMNVDSTRQRIEIAPWVLEELAKDLKRLFAKKQKLEMGIVYEYPSWDRLQTLFEPF